MILPGQRAIERHPGGVVVRTGAMVTEKRPVEMLPTDIAMDKMQGLGFEKIADLPGSTYKDNSTVIIVPTRGMIHARVVQSWQQLIAPMNQKRGILFATGHEVGLAYDQMIGNVLKDNGLSKWKYVMSLEDDNIPPPDAHIRLLEAIEFGPGFDAVSGIYFTKGDYQMPMAYGDPETYRRTGHLEFRPRDITKALQQGNLMEVNGIACGCALWRMDLFRQIPAPWFQTVSDIVDGKGIVAMTQDLNFCEKAKRAGKRFAVDMRVRVGHMDVQSGVVY